MRNGNDMKHLRDVMLVGLLWLTIGLIPAAAPVLASSWDVSSDFSSSQNPNGVWTLGYLTSFGGTLAVYGTAGEAQLEPGLRLWVYGDGSYGGIFIRNMSDYLRTNATNVIEPGKLFWQPGANNEMPTARWTSPVNGQVLINAKFTGQDNTGGCTVDPHVLKNGVSIYDGYVSGFYGSSASNYTDRTGSSPEQTFAAIVQVEVNDTIDFALGHGGNGYGYDGAGLEASVAQTTLTTSDSIGEIKGLATGAGVVLTSAEVVTVTSGTFTDGSYYIEEPGRMCGIKVVPSSGLPAVTAGDRITLTGAIGTDSNGEQCINATAITSQESGLEIGALGMSNKALRPGVGLDTTGLLVRTFGEITYLAPDGSYVYVDDGTGLQDGTGHKGVRVVLNGLAYPISNELIPGQFVKVTGIAGLAKDGSLTVRAIRPRANSDLPNLVPPMNERATADLWIGSNLGENRSSTPFSFTYNGVPSSSFLASWPRTYKEELIDANRTKRTIAFTDPAGRLRVRCVATVYSDFPAVDWTVYFDNIGSTNTRILENIQAMNTSFAASTSYNGTKLYYSDGSTCAVTDFHPREAVIGSGASMRFAPVGGRSSDGVLPFFNLAKFSDSGVMMAVGWTGQWAATFTRTDNTVNAQAGMELTHLRLYPGESIRTPSTVLLFWNGEDRMRGHNLFRQLVLAHYTPTPGNQPVVPPIAAAPTGVIPLESSTQANMIQCIVNCRTYGLPIDTWWIDAGWYECGSAWLNTGNWWPDPARYPNGMKPVADMAHATGYKFMLWFEPERAAGTWLANNHPDWLFGGSPSGQFNYLNLGNPDALAWVKSTIGNMIGDIGIDIYRQDQNGSGPLPSWRDNDASDRQGMNEIKHITGLYDFWDYLLARFPNLLIDNCASGGRRIDIETLRRSLPLWRSDYCWEPVGEQCATYGLSFWLPMTGMGSLETDPYTLWSGSGSHVVLPLNWYNVYPSYYAPAITFINQLKSIRHLFTGDFYALTSYSTASNVWIAWQYNRSDLGEGVIQAFRRPDSSLSSTVLTLRGLVPTATYVITDIDNPENPVVQAGSQLMQSGLPVSAPARGSKCLTYRQQ